MGVLLDEVTQIREQTSELILAMKRVERGMLVHIIAS